MGEEKIISTFFVVDNNIVNLCGRIAYCRTYSAMYCSQLIKHFKPFSIYVSGIYIILIVMKKHKIMIMKNLHGSKNPLSTKSARGSGCQLLGMLNLKVVFMFIVNLSHNDYIRTNITEEKFPHYQ